MTYRVEEVVAVPVPSVEQLGSAALAFSPCIAVCERCVDSKDGDGHSKETNGYHLSNSRVLLQAESIEAVACEVVHLTERKDGKVERWQVVVQEQLTSHQVEGEVVERPAKNTHAHFIVETLESDVVVVSEAALPSDNGESLDRDVESDERGSAPPNDLSEISCDSGCWGHWGVIRDYQSNIFDD